MRFTKQFPWEAAAWLMAFTGLAMYQPQSDSHISLCPLANLGFTFCPGCGLGRSISSLFHGEIMQSLSLHPLGIFAVIVLSFRIIHLTKLYYTTVWRK